MNIEAGSYKRVTASTNVKATAGRLLGIFVSAASSTPTITVYDDSSTGTGTTIVGTFTPTVGYFPMPFGFSNGLYVAISGTVSATVCYV